MSDLERTNFARGLWIGGVETRRPSEQYFTSFNPMDDRPYRTFVRGSTHDVLDAVQSASSAFRTYRELPAREREAILQNAAAIMERRKTEAFEFLLDETGSPRGKAEFEFGKALAMMRAASSMARAMQGATLPSDTVGRFSMSLREPLGVIAAITPFNVPLIKGVRLSANALALGNTVVLLPSELAPSASLFLADVYAEAGLPAGAFNVVTGFGEEIGDALTGHSDVSMVTFTGSNRVGNHIRDICSRDGKRMTLELGGKSPLVVMADADLDEAVKGAVHGIFTFQGQVCMGNSRIFVQRAIFDEFLRRFVAAASALKIGSPRDGATSIGPIISERQRERVRAHIADALNKGAELHCGGQWVQNCCQPTVLTGVKREMILHQEETFGPVVAVTPFDNFDEAVIAANDTRYGLSSAIFTRDLGTAFQFVNRVRAGMVHVNSSALQDEPHVPFGGIKDSGSGREGTIADIEAMTEQKWVTVQIA